LQGTIGDGLGAHRGVWSRRREPQGAEAAVAGSSGPGCVMWGLTLPLMAGGHGGGLGDAGTVAEQPALSFAGLLRQLRMLAKLTQEELAEAAGISTRTVSDLERGVNRTAHKDTARLLNAALGLDGPVGEAFVAAARGRASAGEVLAAQQGVPPGTFAAAASRGLPRDIASFTGRHVDLARLVASIEGGTASGGVVDIHAIDGMAGIGKTTLAVHAAHHLADGFPDGQFFLPLHAHTAGQRPVDPADALISLLLTAGLPPRLIPPGLDARAARWRDQVAGKKILLLLDDASGHEQVAPLLPGTAGSLVLVTSRRRLAALSDAMVISLDTLPPDEAAALLTRLAGRAELCAADTAAAEIVQLCGFLPLAIGMLASQLRHHPARAAAQMAASLEGARDRLALMHAESLSVAAAFDLSYQDLSPSQQRLFRRLGLVPGPTVDAYATAALAELSLDDARCHLDELYDQHLLGESAPGRYRLHDLLREHARALATADAPDETGAATRRLLDYYLHTAIVAGRHFASWAGYRRQPPSGPPADAPDLSSLAQAAAWLETERPNLHAAAEYAAGAGLNLYAVQIPAAISGFLLAYSHVDEHKVLHRTAVAAARRTNDPAGEAVALGELSLLAWMTGDHTAAEASTARALALYRQIGDQPGQAAVLNQLGIVRKLAGDYPAAIASHQQALVLARGTGDRLAEADSLNNLGRTQQLAGNYPASLTAQRQALALFREIGNQLGQAVALNDLGVTQQETGDYPAASVSEREAFELFRDLGNQLGQAVTLNELGLIQQLTADYEAASISHQQALKLHCDLGNRRGQAEALNSIGELASKTGVTQQARAYHSQALDIARETGLPLEEARALEGIGQAHLVEGHPRQAKEHLRLALRIYLRIGAPGAQRVHKNILAIDSPPTT
jgi:tetratricopeptide (TPR) repeat protein/transcriptional regulator with XRE-family HTH domain